MEACFDALCPSYRKDSIYARSNTKQLQYRVTHGIYRQIFLLASQLFLDTSLAIQRFQVSIEAGDVKPAFFSAHALAHDMTPLLSRNHYHRAAGQPLQSWCVRHFLSGCSFDTSLVMQDQCHAQTTYLGARVTCWIAFACGKKKKHRQQIDWADARREGRRYKLNLRSLNKHNT
eukprot:scaffold234147_cov19-Tisochrysis_lutea.AAC.1